jgi:hypothetical protein
MKTFAVLLVLAVLPALASAEDIWRWKDAKGTLHYSNQADAVPPGATRVDTPIVIEASHLPGAPDLVIDRGTVSEAPAPRSEARPPARPHRIYTEQRLRFDCFAGGVLFAGGWSHPDDIANVGNCLPYLLGPEAWLNGARAELALRENGIDWRQLVPWYLAQQEQFVPRVTDARDED